MLAKVLTLPRQLFAEDRGSTSLQQSPLLLIHYLHPSPCMESTQQATPNLGCLNSQHLKMVTTSRCQDRSILSDSCLLTTQSLVHFWKGKESPGSLNRQGDHALTHRYGYLGWCPTTKRHKEIHRQIPVRQGASWGFLLATEPQIFIHLNDTKGSSWSLRVMGTQGGGQGRRVPFCSWKSLHRLGNRTGTKTDDV